jgi:hypothetical protein
MHSWIFRNRRRLERLYGLAPGRPGSTQGTVMGSPVEPGSRSAGSPPPPRHGRAQERDLVLVPQPRRAA